MKSPQQEIIAEAIAAEEPTAEPAAAAGGIGRTRINIPEPSS